MGRFREGLKDYLHFTSNERVGIILLLALCVLLMVIWLARDTWMATQHEPITLTFIGGEERSTDSTSTGPVVYFEFDPNGLPAEQWRRLGLTDKQINGIHNYEKAGGTFRNKQDLRKMYTISDALYDKLAPYIHIAEADQYHSAVYDPNDAIQDDWVELEQSEDDSLPTAELKDFPGRDKAFAQPPVSVELNAATAQELMAIKGIGPAYAKSILKYRELLGGYHSGIQLHEVYILQDRPEVVEKIGQHLTCDTSLLRTININEANAEELAEHIYINWNTAKAIVAYRRMHGPYATVADVQQCALVDESLFAKIAPYFKAD